MSETAPPSNNRLVGDELESLIASSYNELISRGRRLAAFEPKHLQIDEDDLVQEALLRVLSSSPLCVDDKDHFVRIVCMTMRRIIIDRARSSTSRKQREVSFTRGVFGGSRCGKSDLEAKIDLRAKICQLGREDPRLAENVRQHYFGKLSTARVAERLGRSRRCIQSDLCLARGHLRRMLNSDHESRVDIGRPDEASGHSRPDRLTCLQVASSPR